MYFKRWELDVQVMKVVGGRCPARPHEEQPRRVNRLLPPGGSAGCTRGLRDALPIVLAYVPLGAGFGLLARVIGMPLWLVGATSLLLFAGAGQYMVASMLASGVSLPVITTSVILVNLRHLLYSASIGVKLRGWRRGIARWAAVFGLTDEVYAVSSTAPEPVTPTYFFALAGASHLAWIGGSLGGAWLGGLLPAAVTEVLTYSLTALFLALLLGTGRPGTLTSRLVPAAVAGSIALAARLNGWESAGLLAGAVAGTTAGWVLTRRKRESEACAAQWTGASSACGGKSTSSDSSGGGSTR